MTTGGAWPVPPSDSVVVLVDADSAVERDVVDRWIRNECPLSISADEIDAIHLPDPVSSENDAALAALGRELASESDPWLIPVRVVWLPRERGGERTVRLRDVLRHLGDPRHPRTWSQRRIVRSEPDRCRVNVGEPARVSELRARWNAISGDDPSPLAFTQFVARQATLALERAES